MMKSATSLESCGGSICPHVIMGLSIIQGAQVAGALSKIKKEKTEKEGNGDSLMLYKSQATCPMSVRSAGIRVRGGKRIVTDQPAPTAYKPWPSFVKEQSVETLKNTRFSQILLTKTDRLLSQHSKHV